MSCVVFQVFRGLAYIHTVPGVCHRDLKPQNILVLLFDDLKLDVEIEMEFYWKEQLLSPIHVFLMIA